ncbi:hypothetical protein AB0I22_33190 [Streptomyces sp. NPDC050610]|uniref:hypothetical protein n=1 Tax=Streptomyces sp. NPDC050610 TaxID=3157097 RepID=UPI00342AE010
MGLGALVVALVGSAVQDAKLTPLVFLPLAVLFYGLGCYCTRWARTAPAMPGGGAAVVAVVAC